MRLALLIKKAKSSYRNHNLYTLIGNTTERVKCMPLWIWLFIQPPCWKRNTQSFPSYYWSRSQLDLVFNLVTKFGLRRPKWRHCLSPNIQMTQLPYIVVYVKFKDLCILILVYNCCDFAEAWETTSSCLNRHTVVDTSHTKARLLWCSSLMSSVYWFLLWRMPSLVYW